MTLSDDIRSMHADVTTQDAAILVIDDEALFGKAVKRRLERAGYRCAHVTTLLAASAALEKDEPDLVLLDMRLPDGSGLDFLKAMRPSKRVPVVVMTAYGEVDDAVTAMKYAAADYLKKPLDLDELLLIVEKVIAASAVNQRLEYSRTRESNQTNTRQLLGESAVLVNVRQQVLKIASLIGTDSVAPTVLITGETGSGKDVTARLLHQSSSRSMRPFVHVDCAALPKDLIEAELFGHVKGAFTHAVSERTGLIEAAEDGVVFLDEVGEIPLELQAKLLAVLERRMLRRIGSSHERATDAWFIAATNRPVEEMVANGSLRADLYFRLNVLTIELPPLCRRGDDVVMLARNFAAEVARRYGLGTVKLSAAAERCLRNYQWPGNVRELSHVMERAVLLCANGSIGESELALPGAVSPPGIETEVTALDEMTLEQIEKLMIRRALSLSDGNVSEAARRLGITRMAMRYRLQKYQIKTLED